jgi:transposase
LGHPIKFLLTTGQETDVIQGAALIEGQDAGAVIADQGSDSDELVRKIEARGAAAVIPPTKNRKEPRDYYKHLYKRRDVVERFINLIKNYRREATRYEKTARNFLGFIHLAAIMVLLR